MKSNENPPRWAEVLLDRFAPAELAEEIHGDLYEMFLVDLNRMGSRKARRRYAIRVLGFFLKNFFWKRPAKRIQNMTGNYFKIATRSLLANKGTTTINILGLVIGVAASLAIFSVIGFELGFDKFHSNYESTYRLVRVSGEDKSEYRSGIPYAVPPALEDIASIDKITAMEYLGGLSGDVIAVDKVSKDGKLVNKFLEGGGLVTLEPRFFDMFDFEGQPLIWLAGNQKTALTEPGSVVLTRSVAEKYFGKEDPLGQTLRLEKLLEVKVTGVMEDFPANTDFPFSIMLSYSTMPMIFGEDRIKEWVSVNDSHHTYVTIRPGVDPADVEKQIFKIHSANVSKDLAESRQYRLQPLSEVHFDPRFGTFSGRTITHDTILALELIALCLLLVAGINYVNLATAQSTLRSKEVGLRKVMGGTQINLILQFLTETFVVVLAATVVAITAYALLMPYVSGVLGIRLALNVFDSSFILMVLIIVVSMTVFAGVYPALQISRFNPVRALRSNFNSENIGGVNMRKILVVAQFSVTQVLAMATFVVLMQMDFFRKVDIGLDRSSVIVTIPVLPHRHLTLLPSFENELRRLPMVSDVGKSFTLPSGLDRNRSSRSIGHKEAATLNDYVNFEYNSIDEHTLGIYGIRILAGRNLTASDSSRRILINESLVRNLGFQSVQEAIGATLKNNGEAVEVVGVVNDYYGNSLKEGVDNIAMDYSPSRYRQVSVKLDLTEGESYSDAIRALESTWTRIYPEDVFRYRFFDDNIASFYAQEARYSKLFQVFSVIFIVIGCLGLYGLITFIANKKGKEIAIRKTLGATVTNILLLFSREYIVLILISFAIAVPIAWHGVNQWLTNFRNHVELQWWLFVAPGFIILAIALAVVTLKSLNAANANPVDKLRVQN